MMIRRLIALSVLTAVTISADAALAQGVFPAPLPGQDATTTSPSASPLAGAPAAECVKNFIPLREDAEKKGKLIKVAGERHAAPEEGCKLIKSYRLAEVSMIKYLEANATQCGIKTSVVDELKAGRRTTEVMEARICTAAEQDRKRGPRGPVGDFPDLVNGRY